MTGSPWLPALVVLAVGLAVGIVLVFVLRRRKGASPLAKATTPSSGRNSVGPVADPAEELRIADLERRRDDLIERLRDDVGELSSGDRQQLEEAAARTLRELDRLRPRLAESKDTGRGGAASAQLGVSTAPSEPPDSLDSVRSERPVEPVSSTRAPRRHSGLIGFASGVAVVLILGSLIWWVARDAQPDSASATAMGVTSEPSTIEEHSAAADLPSEIRRAVDELETRLAVDRNDLSARKRLAVILLANNRLVPAFEQAEAILEIQPEDPDGLYVEGVVRLAMGQATRSVDLLARVLDQYPDHMLALLARGKAFMKIGDVPRAIASWERGLSAAGGHNAELEWLLESARSGMSPVAVLDGVAPTPSMPSDALVAVTDSARNEPTPLGPGSGAYRVLVDLAPGSQPQPGGLLFAALRGSDGGPPIAVKRIFSPRFPLEIVLGEEDSMLGQPLPQAGTLSVRLDSDGNASTTSPGDLAGQAAAESGDTVRILLAG